jgi:hypothetical protein
MAFAPQHRYLFHRHAQTATPLRSWLESRPIEHRYIRVAMKQDARRFVRNRSSGGTDGGLCAGRRRLKYKIATAAQSST